MLALYMDCQTASSLHIGIWLQKNSPSVDRRVRYINIYIYIFQPLLPSDTLRNFQLVYMIVLAA